MSLPIDYQALFRALPDAYVLMTPDAVILDNTDQHVAVSLLPREQAIGRNMLAAYPSAPESQQLLFESQEYVRRHQQPHTMDLLRYDLARTDGSIEKAYWEATHYPIFDVEGRMQYLLQRTRNVTERVLAEQASARAAAELAEQQAATTFTLDALPLIVWTAGSDGHLQYISRGWFDFTGDPIPADVASYDSYARIHPDDLPVVLTAWRRALEQRAACQFEYRLLGANGEYRWYLGRVAPRFNDEGRLMQWVGASADIHQQRLLVQEMEVAAEQQVELIEQAYRARREVQHQRDTFYDLFRQAPAMICILRGPEHRFEFVNSRYQQLFPHRELVGLPIVKALPEVAEQGFVQILDGVYQTGQTFYGNELEVQLEREAAGPLQPTYFNFVYKQFTDETSKPAGVMVFAFEVTELVRARQRLEKLANTADSPANSPT